MRLVGFAFANAPGPVKDGYVELGDLTAIVGTNDSGKSRLLKLFVAALNGAGEPEDGRFALFAELSLWEIEAINSRTGNHHLAIDDNGRFEPSVTEHLAAEHGLPADAMRRALDEIGNSNVFAFTYESSGNWRVRWCLLPGSAGQVFDDDVTRVFGKLRGVPFGIEQLDLVRSFGIVPVHLTHPAAPPFALDLGEVPRWVLPKPLQVPVGHEVLEDEVAATIDSLLRSARWWTDSQETVSDLAGLDEGWTAAEISDGTDELVESYVNALQADVDRVDLWLTGSSDGSTLSFDDATRRIVERAGEAANAALAPFISTRYRVRIDLGALQRWRPEDPVNVGLETLNGSDWFPLDELADGLRLWVELAVLEAVRALADIFNAIGEAIRRLTASVSQLGDIEQRLDEARARLEEAHSMQDGSDDPEVEPFDPAVLDESQGDYEWESQMLTSALGEINGYLDSLDVLVTELNHRTPTGEERDESVAYALSLGAVSPGYRQPLYVMDEPERYLHPRLQRAVARWLVDLTEAEHVQALIVTHSVPFMLRGQRTRHVAVERRSSEAIVVNLLPEELEAISPLTTRLGLDRGELLASIGLILFVEGEADRLVLESLFGARLRSAGIVVVPFHGVTKSEGIIDAELLVRFTSAKIAVLFDDISAGELKALLHASDEQLRLTKGKRTSKLELKKMAQLMLLCRERGRTIATFGLPVHDIFDLLDDAAIRAHYERWPGHERAANELAAARVASGDPSKPSAKDFREVQYGISKHEVVHFGVIADSMRTWPPIVLVQLVERFEALAIEGALD